MRNLDEPVQQVLALMFYFNLKVRFDCNTSNRAYVVSLRS